jgi:transcriptional regulator with XRE-family HTH domain
MGGSREAMLGAAAGLTQQLAVKAGLSVSNLSQIEQGQKEDPRISTVVALASALGVTVDELLAAKGGEPACPYRKCRCGRLAHTREHSLLASCQRR